MTHVTVRTRGMVGERSASRVADDANVFGKTVPNAFSDDPKYLSWGELQRLRREPERLNGIDSRRRVLAAHLAERVVTTAIGRSLSEKGTVRLVGDEDVSITLHAALIHWVDPIKTAEAPPDPSAKRLPKPPPPPPRRDAAAGARQGPGRMELRSGSGRGWKAGPDPH